MCHADLLSKRMLFAQMSNRYGAFRRQTNMRHILNSSPDNAWHFIKTRFNMHQMSASSVFVPELAPRLIFVGISCACKKWNINMWSVCVWLCVLNVFYVVVERVNYIFMKFCRDQIFWSSCQRPFSLFLLLAYRWVRAQNATLTLTLSPCC